MRTTYRVCCANLRTLGLDSNRQYTAAEIKAAFVEKAKSAHPDAGGDAARFRQVKDAYDALRGMGDTGATPRPSYPDSSEHTTTTTHTPHARRSHIYAERYNDGDGTSRSDSGTWDYGSGTRYANNSTRSFYRPYTSNYHDPSSTGFTREEVARAELAMRLHMLKRIVWNCLFYGAALYFLYKCQPVPQQRSSTDYEVGRDAHEVARRERELRQMQPQLQPEWSDATKARYLEEWNNRFRDREHVAVFSYGRHL